MLSLLNMLSRYKEVAIEAKERKTGFCHGKDADAHHFDGRRLRLEALESRELLSLTPTGADLTTLESQSYLDEGTIYVTTLEDKVSATDGQISLREAIGYAEGIEEIFDVRFRTSGTITLKLGELTMSKTLSIDASDVSSVTLDGHNSSRILSLSSSGTDYYVDLKNFIFKDGMASNGYGGAIYNGHGSSLQVTESRFENNIASESGGAIYTLGRTILADCTLISNHAGQGGAVAVGNQGQLIIKGSEFLSNRATNEGGALYINQELESSTSESDVTITNSLFQGNTSSGHGGAATLAAGTVSVTDSSFDSNVAQANGGAFYCIMSKLTLSRTTITNNQAINGAGLYIQSQSAAVLSDSEFLGNTASESGGGLYNISGKTECYSLSIEGNAAKSGAGVRNDGVFYITNSLIRENTTTGPGGGIYNTGTMSANNLSVSGNTSTGSGAGIYNGTPLSGIAKLTLKRVMIDANQVSTEESGGGVYNNIRGQITANDTFLWNNATTGAGGGMYNMGDVWFYTSRISANTDATAAGFVSTDDSTKMVWFDNQSATILSDQKSTLRTLSDNIQIAVVETDQQNGLIDFGTMAESGRTVSRTVRMTNSGKTTITLSGKTLSGLYADQGIITETAPTDNIVLAPGQSVEFTLSVVPPVSAVNYPGSALEIVWRTNDSKYVVIQANALFASNAVSFYQVATGGTASSYLDFALSNNQEQATAYVCLTNAPTANVTVVLSAPQGVQFKVGDSYVDTVSLTFTKAGYATRQEITIVRNTRELTEDYIEETAINVSVLAGTTDSFYGRTASSSGVSINPYVVVQEGNTLPVVVPDGYDTIIQKMDPTIYCVKKEFSAIPGLLSLRLSSWQADGSTPYQWVVDWGDGSHRTFSTQTDSIRDDHFYSENGQYTISVSLLLADGTRTEPFIVADHYVLTHSQAALLPVAIDETSRDIAAESLLPDSESTLLCGVLSEICSQTENVNPFASDTFLTDLFQENKRKRTVHSILDEI